MKDCYAAIHKHDYEDLESMKQDLRKVNSQVKQDEFWIYSIMF